MIADLSGIAKKLFHSTVSDWVHDGGDDLVMAYVGYDAAGTQIEILLSVKSRMVFARYCGFPHQNLIVSFDELPGLTFINPH